MIRLITILTLLFTYSCTTKRVVKVIKKDKSWTAKKRRCHYFYLNTFGLSPEDTVVMCREELQRGKK